METNNAERRVDWKPSVEQFRRYLAGLDMGELLERSQDIKRRLEYEADSCKKVDYSAISRLSGGYC